MSKEKRRVPKLRFPGFTEDWEQRKFKDIAFKRGKISEADLPYVEFEDINSGIGTLNKNISQKVGHKKGLLFEAGDVLFGKLRPYLQNWLLCQFAGIAVGDFWVLQPQNVSSAFLYYLIQSEAYQSVANISSGTKMPRSSWPLVSETLFSIPKYKEANMIGEFFLLIDRTITLHQRKLNNLKLKKKALLQKLFPKNEERYPELRFPGFTDAWEQRKADYIFKSVTEKGYPELPVLSASQELGMVYRDQNGIDIQHDKKNESSYKRVSPGQFVIHLRSFQGGFAYSEVEGITSPAYTVMSFKNSSEQYGLFWKYVFKSETFIKRLETITYGIRDGRSISFSDFKSLMLQYPSFSEQELIGDLIAVIERGITLHQRKLDHLQLQKKALLQQMFV